jgi:hypothetical protein
MMVKDLIEKLKEFPADMEVVLRGSGEYFEPCLDLELETASVFPADLVSRDLDTEYLTDKHNDYWSFSRVNLSVLVIS